MMNKPIQDAPEFQQGGTPIIPNPPSYIRYHPDLIGEAALRFLEKVIFGVKRKKRKCLKRR